EVLDVGGERYRRTDDPAARLSVLAGSEIPARVALLVRESKHGMSLQDLVARTGLLESDLEIAVRGGQFVNLAQPQRWIMERAWFDATRGHIVKTVRDFHKTNPLLPGIAKQDLRGRELAKAPAFVFDALLVGAQDLAVDGEAVRLRTHRLVLKQDEEEARSAIER